MLTLGLYWVVDDTGLEPVISGMSIRCFSRSANRPGGQCYPVFPKGHGHRPSGATPMLGSSNHGFAVPSRGIEPLSLACKTSAIAILLTGQIGQAIVITPRHCSIQAHFIRYRILGCASLTRYYSGSYGYRSRYFSLTRKYDSQFTNEPKRILSGS